MNFYKAKSSIFLIFIVISAMAFAALPALFDAFAKASDIVVIENMKRVQSEMYFYEIDNGNYRYACIGGDYIVLQNKILLESGNGLSCTTNELETSISLYTKLKSDKIYCVDSLGYQGYIDENIRLLGRCSK